jgi:hypothetical protein
MKQEEIMVLRDSYAKLPVREDETLPTKPICFAAETVCRVADKSLGTYRAADIISGTLAEGNNPFNFQMQALWVNQCAPW